MKYKRDMHDSLHPKSCVFCNNLKHKKLVREFLSFFIYANDYAYCEDHYMVIPKRHIHSELELTIFEQIELWFIHQYILKKFLDAFGSCFMFNRENTPRQSIWHYHKHYTPHDNYLIVDERMPPKLTIRWDG